MITSYIVIVKTVLIRILVSQIKVLYTLFIHQTTRNTTNCLISGSENCDLHGTLIYEDMGCKAMYEKPSQSKCPAKFDCLGLKKSTTNCFLKGKAYKINDTVDSKLTAGLCDLGCRCQKNKDKWVFFKKKSNL